MRQDGPASGLQLAVWQCTYLQSCCCRRQRTPRAPRTRRPPGCAPTWGATSRASCCRWCAASSATWACTTTTRATTSPAWPAPTSQRRGHGAPAVLIISITLWIGSSYTACWSILGLVSNSGHEMSRRSYCLLGQSVTLFHGMSRRSWARPRWPLCARCATRCAWTQRLRRRSRSCATTCCASRTRASLRRRPPSRCGL